MPSTALRFVVGLLLPNAFRANHGSLDSDRSMSFLEGTRSRLYLAGCPSLLRMSVHLGWRGPDTDLRRWGLRLAARGGKNAKKRAVVAVARKLSVLLHRLWVTGERYEPLRHSRTVPSSPVAA
ncbi:MAG: ISAca5, transposase [Bryobacterales bacterium]|nr:ISAca5, transposase [Bryobacterales bacterium]